MADQQETIDVEDGSLFESAMADAPAEVTPEPQPSGQPRDENGRFAAKAPEPEPQEVPAEPVKEEHVLPSWRAREIAEERRAAVERAERAEREAMQFRERLAAMERQNQPKPEPVDIFADPNAWAKQQLSPVEQRMQDMQMALTLRASRAENIAIHGRETVDAAYKAVDDAARNGDPDIPGLRAKMLATDDPVGVAVDWHKSRSLLKETGGDINAYRQRILDEAMKDPAFQAKVIEATRSTNQTKPVVQIPPSLNRVTSAAPPADDDDDGEGGLLRNALRR